ncbi:MAG: phosphoribosylformylglycinamidine synthase [Omnitrophica WOR_2 bacterium SM23_29]|nr:MAG: phosphoribosylformylglycinamidine synthase [Omnitrophica WOR_2 bacterium SM23_29]
MVAIKRVVKVLVLRAAGTNCDYETAFAFEHVGADAKSVHINQLVRKEVRLKDFHILAIPGGFTYGDDIASGKILANELKYKLAGELEKFIRDGKFIIGICNGFQVLVKSGLLPGSDGMAGELKATLTTNDSGRYEDRWVYLKTLNSKSETRNSKCVWTRGLDEIIYLPAAHGEGKFIPKDDKVLDRLWTSGQIVFRYVDQNGKLAGFPWNPNGSVDNIAGICDITGRIFGLMPHPERHIFATQHPRRSRGEVKGEGDGVAIFRNGVKKV